MLALEMGDRSGDSCMNKTFAYETALRAQQLAVPADSKCIADLDGIPNLQ